MKFSVSRCKLVTIIIEKSTENNESNKKMKILCYNKNYCQTVTLAFTNEVLILGENTLEKEINLCSQENVCMTGKWEASGTTEHSKDCYERVDRLHPKTLANSPNIHERKLKESLEVKSLETKVEYSKSIKVLNKGRCNIVNRNS